MATLPKTFPNSNNNSIRPCFTENGDAYIGVYTAPNDDTFASTTNSISSLKSAAKALSQSLNSNVLIYRHDSSALTIKCASAHCTAGSSIANGNNNGTTYPAYTLPSNIVFMYIEVTTSGANTFFIDLTSAHVLENSSSYFTYTLTITKFRNILNAANITLPDGKTYLDLINSSSGSGSSGGDSGSSGDNTLNYRLLRRRASFTRFKVNSGITYNTDRDTLFAAAIDSMNNLSKNSPFLTEQSQATADSSLYEKLQLASGLNIGISKSEFNNIVENITNNDYNNLSTSEKLLYDFIIKLNNNN